MTSKIRIVEAAIHEFAIYGYEAASEDRICVAANLPKPTLLRRFRTKEQLFSATLERCIQDLEECSEEGGVAFTSSTEDDLIRFYRLHWTFFRENTDHYKVLAWFFCGKLDYIGDWVLEKRLEIERKSHMRMRLYLSRVPLRHDVDKEVAMSLLVLIISHIQNKYFSTGTAEAIYQENTLTIFETEMRESIKILLEGMLETVSNH